MGAQNWQLKNIMAMGILFILGRQYTRMTTIYMFVLMLCHWNYIKMKISLFPRADEVCMYPSTRLAFHVGFNYRNRETDHKNSHIDI